jgi:hypothetical protein
MPGDNAMVLKRVGVLSAAKISGTLYAAMGLIFGLIFALIGMASAGMVAMLQQQQGAAVQSWLGPMFGVGALVFFPILYGVFGFVCGAISAVLYNVFSGLVGGLELELS